MFKVGFQRLFNIYNYFEGVNIEYENFTKQYINGEWVDSASGETIDVINPATEEVMGSVAKGNAMTLTKQ